MKITSALMASALVTLAAAPAAFGQTLYPVVVKSGAATAKIENDVQIVEISGLPWAGEMNASGEDLVKVKLLSGEIYVTYERSNSRFHIISPSKYCRVSAEENAAAIGGIGSVPPLSIEGRKDASWFTEVQLDSVADILDTMSGKIKGRNVAEVALKARIRLMADKLRKECGELIA